jgi:exopolyphosphatase
MEEADSINRFLKASRESYSADKVTTVVMGNQSADLDSMASALTFAYYLSNKVDAAVPLMNILRTHFSSRTEVVYLFGELGIDTALLFFKEDIDLDLLNGRGNLRLILVDHNKLERGQDGLQRSLVRILDHHDDKDSYPEGFVNLTWPRPN